ncbi:MAG: aminoacyl-tRNA hydrolase [bacterium]|nr:aminoacyl-tRNA hydrolase [bacterium]
MEVKPRFIIGLGNPGKEYEKTYHSVGFLAVDFLIALSLREAGKNGHCEERSDEAIFTRLPRLRLAMTGIASPLLGARNDKTFATTPLLKSDTYMNQSGNFVKATLKKYKAKPEEILIAHDDSDIELGKYKISFGRGSAGHRGVESIIKSLGTKNFWRLRIGIGRTTNYKQQTTQKKIKAKDFVLKKISKNDLKVFKKVFQGVIASDLSLRAPGRGEAIL